MTQKASKELPGTQPQDAERRPGEKNNKNNPQAATKQAKNLVAAAEAETAQRNETEQQTINENHIKVIETLGGQDMLQQTILYIFQDPHLDIEYARRLLDDEAVRRNIDINKLSQQANIPELARRRILSISQSKPEAELLFSMSSGTQEQENRSSQQVVATLLAIISHQDGLEIPENTFISDSINILIQDLPNSKYLIKNIPTDVLKVVYEKLPQDIQEKLGNADKLLDRKNRPIIEAALIHFLCISPEVIPRENNRDTSNIEASNPINTILTSLGFESDQNGRYYIKRPHLSPEIQRIIEIADKDEYEIKELFDGITLPVRRVQQDRAKPLAIIEAVSFSPDRKRQRQLIQQLIENDILSKPANISFMERLNSRTTTTEQFKKIVLAESILNHPQAKASDILLSQLTAIMLSENFDTPRFKDLYRLVETIDEEEAKIEENIKDIRAAHAQLPPALQKQVTLLPFLIEHLWEFPAEPLSEQGSNNKNRGLGLVRRARSLLRRSQHNKTTESRSSHEQSYTQRQLEQIFKVHGITDQETQQQIERLLQAKDRGIFATIPSDKSAKELVNPNEGPKYTYPEILMAYIYHTEQNKDKDANVDSDFWPEALNLAAQNSLEALDEEVKYIPAESNQDTPQISIHKAFDMAAKIRQELGLDVVEGETRQQRIALTDLDQARTFVELYLSSYDKASRFRLTHYKYTKNDIDQIARAILLYQNDTISNSYNDLKNLLQAQNISERTQSVLVDFLYEEIRKIKTETIQVPFYSKTEIPLSPTGQLSSQLRILSQYGGTISQQVKEKLLSKPLRIPLQLAQQEKQGTTHVEILLSSSEEFERSLIKALSITTGTAKTRLLSIITSDDFTYLIREVYKNQRAKEVSEALKKALRSNEANKRKASRMLETITSSPSHTTLDSNIKSRATATAILINSTNPINYLIRIVAQADQTPEINFGEVLHYLYESFKSQQEGQSQDQRPLGERVNRALFDTAQITLPHKIRHQLNNLDRNRFNKKNLQALQRTSYYQALSPLVRAAIEIKTESGPDIRDTNLILRTIEIINQTPQRKLSPSAAVLYMNILASLDLSGVSSEQKSIINKFIDQNAEKINDYFKQQIEEPTKPRKIRIGRGIFSRSKPEQQKRPSKFAISKKALYKELEGRGIDPTASDVDTVDIRIYLLFAKARSRNPDIQTTEQTAKRLHQVIVLEKLSEQLREDHRQGNIQGNSLLNNTPLLELKGVSWNVRIENDGIHPPLLVIPVSKEMHSWIASTFSLPPSNGITNQYGLNNLQALEVKFDPDKKEFETFGKFEIGSTKVSQPLEPLKRQSTTDQVATGVEAVPEGEGGGEPEATQPPETTEGQTHGFPPGYLDNFGISN